MGTVEKSSQKRLSKPPNLGIAITKPSLDFRHTQRIASNEQRATTLIYCADRHNLPRAKSLSLRADTPDTHPFRYRLVFLSLRRIQHVRGTALHLAVIMALDSLSIGVENLHYNYCVDNVRCMLSTGYTFSGVSS